MKQLLMGGWSVLLLSLLHVGSLHAQEFTPLSWTFFPAADVADPAGASEERLGLSLSHLSVGAAYPAAFAQGRMRLVNGLRYQRLGIGYHDGLLAAPRPTVLHYLRYDLSLERKLTDRWTATAYVTPGLATDFGGSISSDDLHIRTVVLFTRRASARLTYGLGLTYRNRLDNAWLPVMQLDASIGPHFRVDVVAPSHAQLWVAPRSRDALELGVEVRVATTPFHLRNAPSQSAAQRLQYKVVTGGAVTRIRLRRALCAALDGGVALINQLEFDGATTSRTVDLEGGPYIRGAIVIDTGH